MIALLWALVIAAPGDGWRWSGPPRYPNAHPFSAIFLGTPSLDPVLPEAPTWSFQWSHFSTLAISPNVLKTGPGQELVANRRTGSPQTPLDTAALAAIAAGQPSETFLFADTETSRLDIRYLMPLGPRWAVEFEVPVVGHLGGWFDGLIEGFHGAFNFPDLNRGLTPADRTQLFAARGDQVRVFDGPYTPSLGDSLVRGLYAPVDEGRRRPAVALSASLKLPTGTPSRVTGSGSFDFGVGWHLAKRFGDVRLYAGGGHVWHGRWAGLSDVPIANTFDLHLGTEIKFSRQWSAGLHVARLEQALARASSATFGRPAYNLAGGFSWRPEQRLQLDFWFFENLTEANNAYDVGIQSTLRWTP